MVTIPEELFQFFCGRIGVTWPPKKVTYFTYPVERPEQSITAAEVVEAVSTMTDDDWRICSPRFVAESPCQP
jgi:hypothetical protein